MRIRKEMYWNGNDKKYPNDLTLEVDDNATKLLEAVNTFLDNYQPTLLVSSGWRPKTHNTKIGGAPSSNHIKGLAIDIKDTDNRVFQYVLQNLKLAEQLGLYFEDKRWTPTWVHIQLVKPKSGNRIFVPSSSAPLNAKIWDGKYDKSTDTK
jgi:hypothetical protein